MYDHPILSQLRMPQEYSRSLIIVAMPLAILSEMVVRTVLSRLKPTRATNVLDNVSCVASQVPSLIRNIPRHTPNSHFTLGSTISKPIAMYLCLLFRTAQFLNPLPNELPSYFINQHLAMYLLSIIINSNHSLTQDFRSLCLTSGASLVVTIAPETL